MQAVSAVTFLNYSYTWRYTVYLIISLLDLNMNGLAVVL